MLEDPAMPFTAHLVELRRRLVWAVLILGAGSVVSFQYSGAFLTWLARPVGRLVFVAPAEAFQTRVKLAVYGGFLLTLPFLLHQGWLFIARALSQRWRSRLLTVVPLSYGLFMAGVALSLFWVVPAAMRFFLSYASEGVRPFITLSSYLGFVMTLSLAFGAIFQFPLILYVLNAMGVLEKSALAAHRRVIYFGAFIGTAFFTPDMVGQVALSLCTIVLFEIALLAMKDS